MSVSGEKIVAEAKAWLGTPYRHQASCRGAGADCLGLLRGVWRAIYGAEPEALPAYSADWSELQGDEALWRGAARCLMPKTKLDAALGDVVLFRMRAGSVAKHLGIQSRVGTDAAFVHAYSGHGVVESALSVPWARRIVARFEFPTKEVC